MAIESPFLGSQVSQTLYVLDVARRLVNVGGVLNRAVSRDRLKHALATTDEVAHPVRTAALKGALKARNISAGIFVPYDAVVGTGRHRLDRDAEGKLLESARNDALLPAHLRWSWLNTSEAAPDMPALDLLFSNRPHHEERKDYLQHRQNVWTDHPCDAGVLGNAAMWATLPVYAVASSVGAAIGCIVGTVGFGVLALSDSRPQSYKQFVTRSASFTGSIFAATMFGALTTAPAWLALQALRAVGALGKGTVMAVGAGIGAAVGFVTQPKAEAETEVVPPPAEITQPPVITQPRKKLADKED